MDLFKTLRTEFQKTALSLFGSGWVWLVIDKNKLKIITTINQENPLMNTNEKVTYPILGLDLWEHAFYLEYKADKKKYINNFWKVVNWDYVNLRLNFYNQNLEYKSNDSILQENQSSNCTSKLIGVYRDLFNKNPKTKDIYKNKINNILREVFPKYWYEFGDYGKGSPFGIYNFEGTGRSVLNKINTNYTVLCILVSDINLYLKKNNIKPIDFTNKNSSQQIKELFRFLHYLDNLKYRIFNTDSNTFKNVFKKLGKLNTQGDRREDNAVKELKKYFKTDKVFKVGGLGNIEDMHGGIDAKIELDGNLKTIQIKPFKEFEEVDEKIKVMGTGNVKDYKTDLMVFHNDKNGILVFDNNETEIIDGVYYFDSKNKL